jgi:hypothetical protein
MINTTKYRLLQRKDFFVILLKFNFCMEEMDDATRLIISFQQYLVCNRYLFLFKNFTVIIGSMTNVSIIQ